MSRFFIHRPILAWVIAIVIMIVGALAVTSLPVEQYPQIAPPEVDVRATYPGASADTVATTVTQVIEQNLSGIDNLLYMSSTSDSAGSSVIALSFKPGTNADVAAMQVQNRVQQTAATLPTAVQNQGVQVSKRAPGFLMIVALSSTDGSMDTIGLGNVMVTRLEDALTQISGVGEVDLFGAQHSMRVWLDPLKLHSYGLMASDVTSAISDQNTQLSLGQIGGLPATNQQVINATITSKGILKSADEFGDILLRVNRDGSKVLLKDVARIEVGGDSYDSASRVDGKPAAAMAIRLATDANALDVGSAVKAKLAELSHQLPSNVSLSYPNDRTTFISVSIKDVVGTLIEAIVLVFLVMYLFLGNLRATIIPTIVVPVALMGTFAILSAVGFSINVLSLFALVLAIGMLVDDAIVVVENVERLLRDEGLTPVQATVKAMHQISGALVGVTAVLIAVFVPMAFMPGATGSIYRQFSVTITSAMVLSVLLALTLTPALCATLLKPIADHGTHNKGFFRWFDDRFQGVTHHYGAALTWMVGKPLRSLVVYAVICAVAALMFWKLPGAFLPREDQGYVMTVISLPPGSAAAQTLEVGKAVEQYYLHDKNVDQIIVLTGFSFNGTGQNNAMAFTRLKDWSLRPTADDDASAIVNRANAHFAKLTSAQVFAISPPAIGGLGNYAGLDFELEDRAGLGHDTLVSARRQLLALAAKDPLLQNMQQSGLPDSPQYEVDIDYLKAAALGVTAANINATMQIAFGSDYVNNYIDTGRIQKVYVQGDAPYRMMPFDIGNWYVMSTTDSSGATSGSTDGSNNGGGGSSTNTLASSTSGYDRAMVPFSAFSTGHWTAGSPQVERYNRTLSSEMSAQEGPGVSTGQAMAEVERLVSQLPRGIGLEWTGESYQEQASGSQAPRLYVLSILVVFLCLAGLYESWSVPISVILVVPLGVVGALTAAHLNGYSNDIYFKVGLLTTVGLATKNAILIVEYAKSLQEGGMGLLAAAVEAARLRLRPIVMTSLAFGIGVVPLAISHGAGAAGRRVLGSGVLGGIIAATILAIFFVPVFFVTVRKLFGEHGHGPGHDGGRDGGVRSGPAAHPSAPIAPSASSEVQP